jgi:hypothetical protein
MLNNNVKKKKTFFYQLKKKSNNLFHILAAFFAPLKPFLEVIRGQDVILNCETYDSTYFQWFKDGTTLMATSNKFRTVGDDKHSSLVIKQFNEYDEGKDKN